MAFVVAIMLAQRVLELRAVTSEPPYMVFHRDKVQLHPHPEFLPKVVSTFNMEQSIFLPVLCPKPHSSNEEHRLYTCHVHRALAFYVEQTKPFQKSLQLFVAPAEQVKGQPVSTQPLSCWITSCICMYYDLAGVPLPPIVRAHSTRAQASSAAYVAHVPIQDT